VSFGDRHFRIEDGFTLARTAPDQTVNRACACLAWRRSYRLRVCQL